MNLYIKFSNILAYTAIVSMLLQPVAQAKSQSDMVSQVGLKTTANIQSNGLAGLKDLNKKALLAVDKSNKSQSKKVKIEKSHEENLSQLTQDIYWQLKDWKKSKKDKVLSSEERQKVQNWKSQLNDYHQDVMRNMTELTQWISHKKLSNTIKQRHQQAISKINQEVNGLRQQLNTLHLANNVTNTNQSIHNSFEFFNGKQLKRKHQVFDGLSSVALTPDRIAPGKSKADFNKYKFSENEVKSSSNKDIDYSAPELLGTSDEVVINDYILAKVTELENDPVKIYHWVRNNIEWLPSYGAIQASDITLGSGRGNAFDQSSLLIAMLRAANVPSRYAYGTIEVDIDKFTNWVGLTNPEAALTFVQYGAVPLAPVIESGVITKVQMEHIWVEVAIDFNPSRGAKNITPDSWVSLDPSFKQYEVLTGLDPVAISGIDMNQVTQDFIDSGTSNETEGWVQGLDQSILNDSQNQAMQSIENHVVNNISNPTIEDVIGSRRVIIKAYPTLPASTENRILFKATDFIEMQDVMRPIYRLAFDKDILGEILNPLELNFAQLNNHKLTLSFKPATEEDEQVLTGLTPENIQNINELPSSIPAHLIQVVPQVALDEVVIKTGLPMYLGYDLTLYYQMEFTNGQRMNKEYAIPAGSYLNLMLGAGSISIQKLKEKKDNLKNTHLQLDSGNQNTIVALTKEQVWGDIFASGSFGYISQFDIFSDLFVKNYQGKFNLSPIFGSYGYETNVSYLFGVPISINNGGIAFNIYTTRQIMSDKPANNMSLINLSIGILTSLLENMIPEQQFMANQDDNEAVSAVKALQIAASNGQKIYHLTNENSNQITNLNLHQETIQNIQNAINSGYTVITHTDNIMVQSWSGSGYVIMDKSTGNASWIITGGSNGSWWETPVSLGLTMFLIFASLSPIVILVVSMVIATISFVTVLNGIDCPSDLDITIAIVAAAMAFLPAAFGAPILVSMFASWVLANGYVAGSNAACNTRG